MRKKNYRTVDLKNVKLSEVLSRCSPGPVWIGVDIAKKEFIAMLRDSQGHFERPWRVTQPREIRAFASMLLELRQKRELQVAMESTGTYGDALRQALSDAGIEPRRVSGKAVSDYAEILDGVPSAHDGKDAAIVAELMSIGKSVPWPIARPTDLDGELRHHTTWIDIQRRELRVWQGRLEALLSRHWPELTKLLKLKTVTLLRLLSTYGSPAQVAQDPEAAQKLARWGRFYLKLEKREKIVESAKQTVGVRMTTAEMRTIQRSAEQALAIHAEIRRTQRVLEKLAEEHPLVKQMAVVVGRTTACVLYATVGDPHKYHCGEAYRKAMGLNLKEQSSAIDETNRHRVQLKITKRGPSAARRWLFFAALRECKRGPVKSWFEAKKKKDGDRGLGAVVGVMRKLPLAIYAVVVRQEEYSRVKLFPGCQLSRRGRPRNPSLDTATTARLDLSPEGKELKETREAEESITPPPHTRFFAPGSALGSVPTVALSSDQDLQT